MKYISVNRAALVIIFKLLCFVTYAQNNIQLLGHLPYNGGVQCSNLTGYSDAQGHEYALVGNTQGLSIVSIDTPTNPHQVFLVPGATGQQGFWREVREYKGYAYVTTEQPSGLVVVNLNYLPDSVQYHTVNPAGMSTSHTIFIDSNGIAYVNGTDKGQLFLDLNTDPYNPVYLGSFNNNYVHDCFVRNDTMWAACINDGFVKVIDVSNKTDADNPSRVLAQWNTPLNFSHNCWPTDDGQYLFTTDEKPNSTLTCYDVSNLNNVTETDRTQVDPGSNTIIHNTYFLNNYCITSYYTYGITIHDVTRKNNLIEVGNFDSSPNYQGDGFNGAWGVWPYLPSGNIIISDIETGLWIVKPTYKRASYLEGVVKDSICQSFITGAQIEIMGASVTDQTNYLGRYSTGTTDTGTYTIRFSKTGYQTKEVTGVQLKSGILSLVNVELLPVSTSKLVIQTVDDSTGAPLPFIRVLVEDSLGNAYQDISTDLNAEYVFCDFIQSTYSFYAGRWGRVTAFLKKSINTTEDTIVLSVKKGYYDDFVMDYGWTVSSTASSGDWTRGEPVGTNYNGTPANPNFDRPNDLGVKCYDTGNGGGQAGEDDLDNGKTILRSPLFDLVGYQNPYISYYAWFFNDGGQGTSPNDSLLVYLSNGFDTVLIDQFTANTVQSQWMYRNIRVMDHFFLVHNMRIFFEANDATPGHLVEAAVDVFMVVDSPAVNTGLSEIAADVMINAYPNPFSSEINIQIKNLTTDNALIEIYDISGRVLITQKAVNNQSIQLGEKLSSGVYLVQLSSNKRLLKSLKVVKAR